MEAKIAEFFATSGYESHLNQILEGRSGARHELDVLAERSDGVTTFRVAVECKAWSSPIEKDVVAKLSHVVADLGLHKGILVCLGGWTSGAEQTASQLGIEMWGRQDIEHRLGAVAVAGLDTGPSGLVGEGIIVKMEPAQARALIEREAKGRLGLAREEIVSMDPVWLPLHVLQIADSRLQKERFRRPSLKTVWRLNAYEALTGAYLCAFDAWPETRPAAKECRMPVRVKASRISASIAKTFERYAKVVQESAKARHAAALHELGIPTPIEAVSVEGSRVIFLPVFAAVLRSRGGDRVVAVDAHGGSVDPRIGIVLTANIAFLAECLAGP